MNGSHHDLFCFYIYGGPRGISTNQLMFRFVDRNSRAEVGGEISSSLEELAGPARRLGRLFSPTELRNQGTLGKKGTHGSYLVRIQFVPATKTTPNYTNYEFMKAQKKR